MDKCNRGITLIALIITIIILLILSGIIISLTIGDNGILNKGKEATEKYTKSSIKEEIELTIVDIKMENEILTKEIVKNGLIEKIKEPIIIDDELNGEYKGYTFWIDENYQVYIRDKTNNNIEAKLTLNHIGTSEITIKVEAKSNEANIVTYEYIINGEVKETSEQEQITIQELEPKTHYTVEAKVIDAKGNYKMTNIVKIKTEARTYLYNKGNEYIDITGGWIYKGYHVSETPNALTKGNTMTLVANTNTRSWMGTTNKIDFTEFNKLGFKFNGNEINIVIDDAIYYHNGGTVNGLLDIWSSWPQVSMPVDISTIVGQGYLNLSVISGSTQFTEIWLER